MNKVDPKFVIEFPWADSKGYNLNALKDVYSFKELSDDLWVVIFQDGDWYDFTFLEHHSTSEDQKYVTPFLNVSGPSGILKECRHSYWGNDLDGDQTHGYLFYMNFEHVRLVMDFLGNYYDGN